MRRSFWVILGFAVLLGGCGQQQDVAEAKTGASTSQELPAVEVQVSEVISRPLDATLLVTGWRAPDELVAVSAEVPGRAVTVHADFGHTVQRGQVLVELDKTELQLQLDRAKAARAQALARIGQRPEDAGKVPDSTPAIRQAEASLKDVEFKFRNAEKLVASGDISQDRFQELQNMYRSRQAALDAARDEFRVQLASIQSLNAEVALAEERLADATVYAPFDGMIGEKMVAPGQFVKENTPLMQIVKTTPLRLRVDIPEVATRAVRVGSDLVFTTEAVPGLEFHATVRRLDPQLETQSRSFVAEARLVREDPRLRPGMFVQVRLTTARGTNATLVPNQALYRVAGLTKVFTVKDGKAIEHRVTPGREFDGWIEIPGRIAAGDEVATSNLANLVDGQPVQTVRVNTGNPPRKSTVPAS